MRRKQMKYILFDLDGTLTNPVIGITKSIQYALNSKGIHITDLNNLTKYIGPPLRNTFVEFGFNEEEAEELVTKYREYYRVTGIYENEVYDGIEELLQRLKEDGKKLYTATSKPEHFAKIILEHFQLSHYFEEICGATMDDSRGTKEEVIRYVLEKNKITDLDEVVMIGDREHDVEGAKKVGVASIGVLFGYGSRGELIEAGADHLAATVEEIYDIIKA
jgi:phosphoglycolate phosphatase